MLRAELRPDPSPSSLERSLPKDWCLVRLGEVVQLNPRRPRIDRAADYPTTFVAMTAIDEVTGTIIAPEQRPYGVVQRGYTYFTEGDVLFAKIAPCMQNGKHAIARHLIGGMGFGSTEFHVLRPSERVMAEWVHSYLRQPRVLKAAQSSFTGAVGQQRVPPKFLDRLVIPLPPLNEQQRVVRALDNQMAAVSRARAATERELKDVTACETVALRKAFRIRPITVDGGQKAPKGWRWHQLLDLARLESGHTPSRRHPEWWGGNVPWLALPDIRALDGQTVTDTLEKTNEAGLANSSARLLPKGTVALSRTASVGFVAVMGRPMATSQDFVNWVCGPKLLPWYLAYALIASRDFLFSLSSGAIHKTIYVPTVKSLQICVPPLEWQRRIVAEVEGIRTCIHAARAAIGTQFEAIDRLPVALLAAAFRGEL